ncbi:MAG TPA: hypothetical protein VFC19_18530 [Candidatus Limnocylindrales bacterium]|nr:hypothetical protein [Candidatus Limnocylindrales bacterium]
MGWHYFEPAPRAYQGEAWERVIEDSPAGTVEETLSLYALIDVWPHRRDDHAIRPMVDRQEVECLAVKLAGTLYGISRPARTAQVARLDWAGDGTSLIITRRAGTGNERAEIVDPDERGLYQVVFDALAWRLPGGRFHGRQALERTWYRLDLMHRERGPILSEHLMRLIRDEAALGLGEVLAEFLYHTMPHTDEASATDSLVPQMLARIAGAAAQRLARCGGAEIVTAMATDEAMTALTRGITEQLGPVVSAMAERERAQHTVAPDGTITCLICERTLPSATAAHIRHGWICAGCGAPHTTPAPDPAPRRAHPKASPTP